MRRIALIAASFAASAALSSFLLPVQASALTVPTLQKRAVQDGTVHLARRGGFRGEFRGGYRAGFRGGYRAGVRTGFRGYGYRGGRYGWRRGWRGPGRGWGWGAGAAALAAAPYYYGGYYGRCPLVRRTVWTPRGYRLRWVRRC
jgi:hypothetical protein